MTKVGPGFAMERRREFGSHQLYQGHDQVNKSCRLLAPAQPPLVNAWLVDDNPLLKDRKLLDETKDPSSPPYASESSEICDPRLQMLSAKSELNVAPRRRRNSPDRSEWRPWRLHVVTDFPIFTFGGVFNHLGSIHASLTPRARAIFEQLMYYFSSENLGKDSYLRALFDPIDGGVPVIELLNFNRIRALTNSGKAIHDFLGAVRCIPSLQLLDGGARVRLRSWLTWVPKVPL